jgi:hypothetical protein
MPQLTNVFFFIVAKLPNCQLIVIEVNLLFDRKRLRAAVQKQPLLNDE